MKIPITGAHARVRGDFYQEGSVLRGTVTSGCTGVSLELTIESPGERSRIAKIVRNAERMCFVSQALVNPTPVQLSVTHNGESVAFPGSAEGPAEASR